MKTSVDSRLPLTDEQRSAIEKKLEALTDEALQKSGYLVSIEHDGSFYSGEVRANHLHRTLLLSSIEPDERASGVTGSVSVAKKSAPKKAAKAAAKAPAKKTAPKKGGKR